MRTKESRRIELGVTVGLGLVIGLILGLLGVPLAATAIVLGLLTIKGLVWWYMVTAW